MSKATRVNWSLRKRITICAVGLTITVLLLTTTGLVHPAWIAVLSAVGAFGGYVAGELHKRAREA